MSHPESESTDDRSRPVAEPDDAFAAQAPGHEAPAPGGGPLTGGTGPAGFDAVEETAGHAAGSSPETTSETASKTAAAKEQGQQVKDEAVEGGKHVVGVASEQARSVVSETTDQAEDLLEQARSQLASQAAAQQENLTAWLRSLADELHEMVDRGSDRGSASRQTDSSVGEPTRGSGSDGVAATAISQVQGRVKGAADWLEMHEPSDLLDEATRFARQRPGAFLAIAAVGGLLVGRLSRGLKDDASADTTPETSGSPSSSGAAPERLQTTRGQGMAGQPDEMGSTAPSGPTAPASPTTAWVDTSGTSWQDDR